MISAAIFDLDGTLLDSMEIWNELDAEFLRSLGKEPRPGLQEAVMALTLRQSAAYFQTEYGIELSEDEIIERIDGAIHQAYAHRIELKAGARQALELLRARGIPMAVATATELHMAQAALERLGVLDWFSGVFTCEMVGKGKREPDVFLAAAKHLGAEPGNSLVFEDAPFAARTAYDAGFKVAFVHDAVSARSGGAPFAAIHLHDFKELEEYLNREGR
jgi:HAD superfamily hydrolase (TIGR01509 family)